MHHSVKNKMNEREMYTLDSRSVNKRDTKNSLKDDTFMDSFVANK